MTTDLGEFPGDKVMTWMPNKMIRDPIYQQIARHYESLIIEGKLLPGASLPSERRLAEQLGVNRSTVVSAYAELRSTGLIQSASGRGTCVSETLWGVSLRHIQDWKQYTTDGVFQPTLPLLKRLRNVSTDSSIINLARGELSPELLPSDILHKFLHALSVRDTFGYSHPYGSPLLRETICRVYDDYGISTKPDNILITSGSQQALHLITQCLLSPGDAVALEGPSYAYSLPLFASAKVRLYRIPMDENGLQPEVVKELYYKHRIRMLFVNPTYQNPTGTTLTMSRRKRLLQICEELRIPVVEDDAYSQIRMLGSPEPPDSLMKLRSNVVIHVGSMSKMVAPGLRIGWIIAPSVAIDRLADAKEQMDFGMNSVVQELANMYLLSDDRHSHLLELNRELTRRRDRMLEELEIHAGDLCQWNIPLGGYHVWCKVKWPIRDGQLLENCISQGVIVTPGSIYGAEHGFIRLTYARTNTEQISQGVERLAQVLRSMRK